mmetsp:Transcript_4104/g.6941  ORF Transcript_4104/g.6941 Transcript_4104/m.6941 type:complete len:207 (+) Transcript_4104:1376-1996(+)
MRDPVHFDKLLVSWGSERQKLRGLSNVYTIEDKFSHAKVHNQLLKSKKVVVLGSTFEAFQMASSAREYLDSVGQFDTEIILMNDYPSEVRSTLNQGMELYMDMLLKKQRISFLPNAEVLDLVGDNAVTKIKFYKELKPSRLVKRRTHDRDTEYFIDNIDMVIYENGMGPNSYNLMKMVPRQDKNSAKRLSMDEHGIPAPNEMFSLI